MPKQAEDQANSLRCQSYYQEFFKRQTLPFSQALEATLHVFLNGSPASSTLTSRLKGLTQASFWQSPELWPDTPVVRFALSQVLRAELALDAGFFNTLIKQSPSLLRAAIRHAQLFRNTDSPLYAVIKRSLICKEWNDFFSHCDNLVAEERRLQQQLNAAEKKLKFLSPFAFTYYLSLVLWDLYLTSALNGERDARTQLCAFVLGNKFKQCLVRDLRLTESAIRETFVSHFKPLLSPFPELDKHRQQAHKTFDLMIELVSTAQDALNHQGEIERFSVAEVDLSDPQSNHGAQACTFSGPAWLRTGQKYQLLWHYWIQRGMSAFMNSGLDLFAIAKPEQQDAVWLAWTRTYRTLLQIEALYGVDANAILTENSELGLLELVRFIELSSVYLSDQFTLPLMSMRQHGYPTLKALSKLMLDGMLNGENKTPIIWATLADKSARMQDWFKTEQSPDGNRDVAKAAIEFWSLDTHDFAPQASDNSREPARIHEKPLLRFGDYVVQLPVIGDGNDNFNALVNLLRRCNSRRQDLKKETHAAENFLATMLRDKGFTVIAGYQPPKTVDGDVGEVDLICAMDDVVILIEMKTSYVRGKLQEIWLHRHTSLRKASWQLKRKQQALLDELQSNSQLRTELGLSVAPSTIHAWIVDTSIEFDGQAIDNFLVVSREVLEVVLRDELDYLQAISTHEDTEPTTFYPNGFNAARFIEVIEQQLIWADIEQRTAALNQWRQTEHSEFLNN